MFKSTTETQSALTRLASVFGIAYVGPGVCMQRLPDPNARHTKEQSASER